MLFAGYLYLGGDLYYYSACGFVGLLYGGVLCKGSWIDNSMVVGFAYC